MEPEGASNHIKIHITAGESGRLPEVLSCQSEASFRAAHVEKAKEGLVNRGIPKVTFEGSDHVIVVELSCNPGCEKELAGELNRLITAEQKQECFICDLLQSWTEASLTPEVFESQNKVYLIARNNEIRELSETSKTRAFYQNVKPPNDIRLNLQIEGEKVKTEENEGISMSWLDLLVEYPASKELGTVFHKFLVELKEDFPLIAVLPNLRRADIRCKLNSPEEISQMIQFQIKETDIKELFPDGKTLIQNEFRVCYFNAAGFMVDTTVKLDHMKFCLSKYFFKAVDYVDRLF